MTVTLGLPSDESSLLVRFSRVYNGLPLGERKNVIVVIGGIPINWEMAYREIKQNTELGEKIGKKLTQLELI